MSENKENNAVGVKGKTEVLKPVSAVQKLDARNYSHKNTQPKNKRKMKEIRKKNKEIKKSSSQDSTLQIPKTTIKQKNSPAPSTKQALDVKEKEPKSSNPRNKQIKASANKMPSLTLQQAKDPNKTYFMIGAILIIVAILMFAGIAGIGFPYYYNQGIDKATEINATKNTTGSSVPSYSDKGSTSQKDEPATTTNEEQTTSAEACQHAWEEVATTIHHEAVTHNEEHPAEYKTVAVYHTICNVCGEKIDDDIMGHKQKTGHYSWSTNVPCEEQQLIKEAYTQTITDQDAYDEKVIQGRKCAKCGLEELY